MNNDYTQPTTQEEDNNFMACASCKQLCSQLKAAEEVIELLENMLDQNIIDDFSLYTACINYRSKYGDGE